MTAISLDLPDALAEESKRLAQTLGISRTELIRRALEHELSSVAAQVERKAMADAFEAMNANPGYVSECEVLDQGFDTALPEETDNWWDQSAP